MEDKIIEKPAFNLVGLKKQVTVNQSGINEEIKAMNQQMTKQLRNDIASLSNVEPVGIINASMNFIDRHLDGIGKFDRIIGAATTDDKFAIDYDVQPIEALTWAVFECSGVFPDALHNSYREINEDFFQNSMYLKTVEIEMVIHITPPILNQHYQGQVWIPVKLSDAIC